MSRASMFSEVYGFYSRRNNDDPFHKRTVEDTEAMKIFKRAHKFEFDGNTISEELFNGAAEFSNQLSEHNLLDLPYNEVAFLFGPLGGRKSHQDKSDLCHVAVAWKVDGGRVNGRMYDVTEAGHTFPRFCTYDLSLSKQSVDFWDVEQGTAYSDMEPSTLDDLDCKEIFDAAVETNEPLKIRGAGKVFRFLLYACLGLLNSDGVEQERKKEPKFINAKRAAKGKPPIFEHTTVFIDLAKLKIPGFIGNGTHAPPRLHWRRGHVRTLASGRKTIVRPCLVGRPENGMIDHDYKVSGGGHVAQNG